MMQNSTELQQAAQIELAKRELARRHIKNFVLDNFPEYNVNWHHDVLFDALERVEKGELKRLMVFMPPRHGKSEICSVQFPAWAIGRDKDKQIIEASYSADLAVDFGRQVRNMVASDRYGKIFNTKLSEDSSAKGKWNTNGRGAYNAVGVGGSMTGKGAHILIIDDPIKNREEAESEVVRESIWQWYVSTARTRLMPDGAIVVVQTRWHDDDLAGRILKGENAGLWEIINLPAIAEVTDNHRTVGQALWPSRYPVPVLEEIRTDIGTYNFSALFQQNPVDEASQEFKKEWFTYVQEKPPVNRMYITIDTAISEKSSGDNTGIVKNYVTPDNVWNIEAFQVKINPLDLFDYLFKVYLEERPVKIGIEKTIYLQAIKPFLDVEMRKRNIFLPIVELEHNQVQKETRIRGLLARYQSRSIRHIVNKCGDLEAELIRFPKGLHDDVADALAYQAQIVTTVSSGSSVTYNQVPVYGNPHRKK